mgnify:CR=1 FL=1
MDVGYWVCVTVDIENLRSDMTTLKNSLKAILYFMSIVWTVWIIFKEYPTKTFSYFDTYVTMILMLSSMTLNDFMK